MTLLNRFHHVGARCGKNDAYARLREIHNCQSNEERGCGYNLEIDQRLDSHAPHLLKRTGARDSDHDG
jgi:hypothetical protein